MLYILVAMLCLSVVGTALSRAGRLSRSLQHFRNLRVDIRIWGERRDDMPCEIHAIRAIFDGLHLFVKRGAGATEHIKIAQPREYTVRSDAAQIAQAKYVQWAGKKCQRVDGQPAVIITIV